jgi:hypothetical protein
MGAEMMHSSVSRKFLGFIAVLALLLCGASAQAALLNTGNTLFPVPGEVDPVGGVVVGTLTTPFAVPGFFTGSITTNVIRGDTTNPNGANALTFTYKLNNAAASPNAIARVTLDTFTGFTTDVSYQTPASGVIPTLADRLAANVVGFSYNGIGAGPIFPGTSSALMVVQTNATLFGAGLANIIDSGAITVATLGPVVPEPAALGVLVLAGGALLRRRA